MQKFCAIIIFLNCLLSIFGAECPNIVTRNMWGGLPAKSVEYMQIPVNYVIVSHTVTPACDNLFDCSEIVENIRSAHMETNGWNDIGFNFLIGGDGNVYEGTGWHRIGAHTYKWNSKSIGICFIGNFSKTLPNLKQLQAAKNLLKCGVSMGELAVRYKLLGQRQVVSTNFATKYCLPNGSWYYDEKLNQTWTNYTQCLIDSYHGVKNSTAFRKWFPYVKTVSQTGYSVSLTTLIIAIIIFSSIKKLRCARNRLHLHLFISFSMRAFMALLKDALFLKGVAMSQNLIIIEGEMFITEPNAWICKLITTAWEYFILANYMWILMEGLYLHNLIFTSLFSDNSAITLYVCFGWGVPSFFTISWAFSRIYYEDTLCWTTHTNKLVFMLIRMPIVLSVLTSFVLFLNIVRVLLVKLNSVYIQRRKVRYRRLVRSTLVLVPLFGVHYSIFLAMSYIDLNSKPIVMLVWLFCDQFLSSFQGFCVAMLYCLLNGEVRAELKRKFTAWKYRERGQRFTSYATISFRAHSRVSIPLTEIRKPS